MSDLGKLTIGQEYRIEPNDNLTFPDPLCLEFLGGGRYPWERRRFRVTHEFRFRVRWNYDGKLKFTVPAGFETDLATIPWVVSWIIHPEDRELAPAAVCHDYAYAHMRVFPRFPLDALFRNVIISNDAPFWKEAMVYYSVRIGGQFVFKRRVRTAEDDAERKRRHEQSGDWADDGADE